MVSGVKSSVSVILVGSANGASGVISGVESSVSVVAVGRGSCVSGMVDSVFFGVLAWGREG